MASSINASTAGAGGVITTADASGILNLQSGGTTVATVNSTGIVMASNTAPAFSAYLSTTTSIAANTPVKVTFDTENFDTNNNFASSRFTPTIAGYYQLNTSVDISLSSSITRFLIQFFKNGVAFSTPEDFAVSAFRVSASGLFYFNGTTDYMEVYGYVGATSPAYVGGQSTGFSGFLARSA
jgi:hypothetical protein